MGAILGRLELDDCYHGLSERKKGKHRMAVQGRLCKFASVRCRVVQFVVRLKIIML